MASFQSIGLRTQPGYGAPPPQPPVTIPGFNPIPLPAIPPLAGGVPRINAGVEQNIVDEFGLLPEKYKYERQTLSEDLQKALKGLNYKFEMNPDGTLRITSGQELGTRQKQAIQSQKNVGSARGQLYSSFTDQAIGNAMQQLGTYGTEAIGQYGRQIKQSNDNFLTESRNLGTRLSELLTDDAKWAAEHVPPLPPQPTITAPSGTQVTYTPGTSGPGSVGGAREWVGQRPPNMQTLAARWGVPVSAIRVTPVGGRYWAYVIADLPNSAGGRIGGPPMPGGYPATPGGR